MTADTEAMRASELPAAESAYPTARRESRWDYILFVLPLLLLALLVFDVPLLTTALWSIRHPDTGVLTTANYVEFVEAGYFLKIIWRTLVVAIEVTLLCALLGYPLAFWISRLPPKRQMLMLGIVVTTFWVSILVRTYAWIVILGNGGIVNRWLQGLGLTSKPVEFLYNENGVLLGMVNVLLPFLILPLAAAMRRVDPKLLQVAETLGASRMAIFWRVFFPLTVPALSAAMVLVFILSLGFYITPAILGGGKVPMIANMMDLLINKFARWEMAAVNAVVLLMLTLVLYAVYQRLRERA
jgi:putative spermidine/putrescine transport system permease protein